MGSWSMSGVTSFVFLLMGVLPSLGSRKGLEFLEEIKGFSQAGVTVVDSEVEFVKLAWLRLVKGKKHLQMKLQRLWKVWIWTFESVQFNSSSQTETVLKLKQIPKK